MKYPLYHSHEPQPASQAVSAPEQKGFLGFLKRLTGWGRDHASETRYQVVTGASPTASEQMAADELRHYLARITGQGYHLAANAPRAEDAKRDGQPAIYLGDTAFARSHGVDVSTMGPEQWVIQSVGEDLIIAGGKPRGTLYGVYDLLEKEGGVVWMDFDGDHVPPNPGLRFAGISRGGEPTAKSRIVMTDFHLGSLRAGDLDKNEFFLKGRQFYVRNRTAHVYNMGVLKLLMEKGAGGILARDGGHDFIVPNWHSFYHFVNPADFFKSHPEYFGFDPANPPATHPGRNPNEKVRRQYQYIKGELCLTNPEVREIFRRNLLAMIREDREKTIPETGLHPGSFYVVTQMDNSRPCPCPGDRAFVAAHGEESDLMLDFVNEMAEAVGKEFPDVTLLTFAYNWTLPPPKTVRPRENVGIIWCNWGWGDFDGGDNGPFLDRPLTHPDNSKRLENLKAWEAVGAHLYFWDYAFVSSASVPFVYAPVIPANTGLIQSMNPVGFFLQSNEASVGGEYYLFPTEARGPWGKESFSALRHWLTMRLMFDPQARFEDLIPRFMDAYYGAAAPAMMDLYTQLAEAQEKPRPPRQLHHRPMTMEHLTPQFFHQLQKTLDRAEAALDSESLEYARVRLERLRVDKSLLDLWSDLERQLPAGESLPFDRNKIVDRFEEGCRLVDARLPWVEEDRTVYHRNMERMIRYYRAPRLPEPIASAPARDILEIDWGTFSAALVWWPRLFESTPWDEHSATGAALCFDGPPGWEAQPVTISLAGSPALSKRIQPAEIPFSDAYQLLHLGRTRLSSPHAVFTVKFGEHVPVPPQQLDLLRRVNARDARETWDVYVACKGVKGPKSKDRPPGLWIERIFLVRSDTQPASAPSPKTEPPTNGEELDVGAGN